MKAIPRFNLAWGVVALCVLSLFSDASAQTSGNGSVRGRVLDEQGNVLPQATVLAESPTVPLPARATSDEHGVYRLSELLPAEYTITFEHPGFAQTVLRGIVIRAGLNSTLDVKLVLSSRQETVTVNSTAPLLETKSAAIAFNLSGDLQRALPLSVNKHWMDFLAVTPGVVVFQNQPVAGQVDTYTLRGSGQGSNVVQIDGADMRHPTEPRI